MPRFTVAAPMIAALAVGACTGGGNNAPAPPEAPPQPPPPPTAGLDARPQNQTCVAPDRNQGGASVSVSDAFAALPSITFATKALVEPGVADSRWFVLRKTGQLVVFDPDNATSTSTYLNIAVNSDGEGGLLGLAFHPDYPAVAEIFLSYTVDGVGSNRLKSVVSRVILDDIGSPGPIGAGSIEQIIIEIDQFQSNHNGGDIAFGPAPGNHLFIGLGDGGGAGDPQETGQDTTRLLGSMLRLDVLGPGVSFPSNPYEIPGDNPFSANARCGAGSTNANACPEIYAWGLRNPWRFSFDPPSGELWLGDVGQAAREEVNLVELGGNYGWDCREGTIAHTPTLGCIGPTIDPVAEYDRANGDRSITGGFVYRGSAIPALQGRYVFGDFVSGRIWALRADGQGGYDLEELVSTGVNISSFGVQANGEMFYTDFLGGRIMQLVPSGGGGGQNPVPDLLSASGCVDPGNTAEVYAGLVPYEPGAQFWSDGSLKDRYIGLPDGTTIEIDGNDDFVFPAGTVLVKNFRLNGRLIETRHLMRHPDGVWAGYTYEWNSNETDATRVRGGKTVDIDGQDWIYPDEAECLQCHTTAAGVALGVETAQLNNDFRYPSTGRTANQLETLDGIVMFSSPLPSVDTLPAMPDPMDTGATVNDRARAYLHTNCAQCHQPGGPTPVNIDLRYTTALANTNACNVAPSAGDVGLVNPGIITPGDAGNSVLVARTALRDINGMPPIASARVDQLGVALLSDWIDGLAGCN